MELKTYFAQDASGNIMPGAAVTVYLADTLTLATGLLDENESALTNPFNADSDAKVAFYAPDGLYDINVVSGIRSVTIRAQFVSIDGAGILRSDLASTASGDGLELVGFIQTGAGSVSRNSLGKVRELPRSPADYSTAQQALTAAGSVAFPEGDVLVSTTLTAANAAQSIAGPGRLLANASNITLLQLVADVTRTRAKQVAGLRADENSKTGVTGFAFGSVTNNPSPGAQEATLYQAVRDTVASGLAVGYDSQVSMEHSWDNTIAYQCAVGAKFYSDAVNGGQNANGYRALRCEQNTVGVALRSFAGFPVHNNLFDGITLQSNTVCGFFAMGFSAAGKVAGLTIRSFHIEGNGTGASTYSLDGATIKKSDFHFDRTQVNLADSDLATALSPAIIAENNSVVHASNLTGYGSPSGVVFQPDATSLVYESGLAVDTGVKFIETYGFLPSVNNMITVGAPLISVGVGRNDSTMANPIVPELTNTTGVASIGNAWDSELGIVSQVTFATSVGSTSTNRNYWYGGAVTSGESIFTSFLLKSSVNTTVRIYVLLAGSVLRTLDYPLVAGVSRRVVLTGVATNTTGMEVYIFPLDTVGATLSFRGFQYLHTTDLSTINRHYHYGLVGSRTLQYESCATPPTTTGVPRGFIVWSPTPAASTSPGSMNVSATTTPSWKTLPALGA